MSVHGFKTYRPTMNPPCFFQLAQAYGTPLMVRATYGNKGMTLVFATCIDTVWSLIVLFSMNFLKNKNT